MISKGSHTYLKLSNINASSLVCDVNTWSSLYVFVKLYNCEIVFQKESSYITGLISAFSL
jgi:hypothetical protein